MIYIASDHGGFDLKNKIIQILKMSDIEIEDMGPEKFVPDDDYPDYVKILVKKIQDNGNNKGILICRNGVGVSMMANKYKGIRAGLSWNTQHAISSRKDDDTNILALPADYITSKEALDIVAAWLSTPFLNEERFIRRIKKADQIY